MLVLSRWKGEEIMIGDNIRIAIVEVREDGRVRVGIDAPKDVSIHRREVYDAIHGNGDEGGEGGGNR